MKASSFTYLQRLRSWSRSRMKSSPILCSQWICWTVYLNLIYCSLWSWYERFCWPRRWPLPAQGCTSPTSGGEWCRWSCFGTCAAPFRRSPWSWRENDSMCYQWTHKCCCSLHSAKGRRCSFTIHTFAERSLFNSETYTVALRMSEWIWATPFTAWEPTMHKWAMLILFWPPSSMSDIRRRRSWSPGNLAETLCKRETGYLFCFVLFFYILYGHNISTKSCNAPYWPLDGDDWSRRQFPSAEEADEQTGRPAISPELPEGRCGWCRHKCAHRCPRPGRKQIKICIYMIYSAWLKIKCSHRFPPKLFLINQDPHQLRNCHGWVGVIQLDGNLDMQNNRCKYRMRCSALPFLWHEKKSFTEQ